MVGTKEDRSRGGLRAFHQVNHTRNGSVTLTFALDGWTLDGEAALLAWLADEAVVEGIPGVHVQYVLVGDEAITELNEQYLEHEGATDVITFDLRDDLDDVADDPSPTSRAREEQDGEEFGETAAVPALADSDAKDSGGGIDGSPDFPDAEVYVSLETAVLQAADYRCTVTEEISRLMLHGLLHVAGWSDNDAAKRRAMSRREDEGLARAGRESGALAWQFNEPEEQRG